MAWIREETVDAANVIKLTRDPSTVREADVDELRTLGLTDEQVLSVVLITCTFNFMTRLADGLAVEFPAQRQRSIEAWLTSEKS